MCDMTHSYVWHDSFIRVTWITHMCDMTHKCDMTHLWCRLRRIRPPSYVWHDSLIRVTWLTHKCDMTHLWCRLRGIRRCAFKCLVLHMWHDSFIRVTWLIHTCGMTHSYVWHDSFIRVTWLIRDSFIRVTWLMHTRGMTHSCVRHDSSLWMRRDSFTPRIQMSGAAHMTRLIHIGWWRPIGCLIFIGHFPQKSPIISVSFAKMTCNLRHPMGLRHPVRVTWLLHTARSGVWGYTCDRTYLYVWHASFIRVAWLIHVWDMTHPCEWDVTPSYRAFKCLVLHMWHDSFIRGTWLIHTCGMTHSCVRRDSSRLVLHMWHDPWLIHTSETWLIHTSETWLIHVWDMTHHV